MGPSVLKTKGKLSRIERMFEGGIEQAIERLRALDAARARLEAEAADLLAAIDAAGVYAVDGHSSAKVMARHVCRLAGSTAASRERVSKMMRDLPELADAFRAGTIGVDQMNLLGRVHRNARVRPHMADAQDWFLAIARRLSFKQFETEVRTWERLADEDGPEPNDRMFQARRFKLAQDPVALTWEATGRMSSMMGAQLNEIFEHYTAAELAADWEKARAEHGDDACELHLPRTADQRSADALWQVFQDAASSPVSAVPPGFCHDIVWDADTYEEMLRRLDGQPPRPLDVETFKCETLTGIPVEPYEAAAHSLVTQIRRVIVDQTSTVIDLGRARTFTGNARTAAKLQSNECFWPGCHVRVDRCQIDHTRSHSTGGRTNPGNGAPACGRHNRLKQNNYRVWRDPAGHWHTHRPDGTEIAA